MKSAQKHSSSKMLGDLKFIKVLLVWFLYIDLCLLKMHHVSFYFITVIEVIIVFFLYSWKDIFFQKGSSWKQYGKAGL
jgi:hypothetical protein